MSVEDRVARLEHRIEVLEGLVRALVEPRGVAAEAAAGQVPPDEATRGPLGGDVSRVPAEDAPAPARPAPVRPAWDVRSSLPAEQWIGQRGLLAVGVVALIMAAGYLLKLSFERGWIPPVLRCAGGAAAGAVVGAIGWRLHARYRTYGAALIGCGAAIIYLSVWAASRLYEVLPPVSATVGLALVSVALATIAYAIDVEALGATAALGALLAPILLGRGRSSPDLLLLYLASMSAGLGLVASRRRWRLAAFVVAAGFFGVGAAGASDRAAPWGLLLYGVLGGSAGLALALREGWWETRLLAFSGGWFFLAQAGEHLPARWPILLAALALAAPVWWHALRRSSPAPWAATPGEGLYFLLTPLLLGWAVRELAPSWFDRHPGLVPLLVAVPYLAAGYVRVRPAFAFVGAAALGIAAWLRWDGPPRVWALLALAVLWAALDHLRRRADGRWYALGTLAVAVSYLYGDARAARTAADAAFVGPWAVALWASAAVTLALAAGLWRSRRSDSGPVTAGAGDAVPAGLWLAGGALILVGVTDELRRHFALRAWTPESAALAAGLAVSAWWLVFAAAVVGVGFWRGLKPARLAGLVVAGLAVVKVVVFDLSSLDALYRVGSVFILGLVSLSLAYLYHRQAHGTGPGL